MCHACHPRTVRTATRAGDGEARIDGLTLPHCAHGTATANVVLNVREGMGTGSRRLGQLQPGQSVTVWAVDGAWAIVQAENGLTGWCAVSYLALGDLTQ